MSAPATIPCPFCGYDLRGLVTLRGATCPECGHAFSRAQVAEGLGGSPPFGALICFLLTPAIIPIAAFLASGAGRSSTSFDDALVVGVLGAFPWAWGWSYPVLRWLLASHAPGRGPILAVPCSAALGTLVAVVSCVLVILVRSALR